MRLVTHAMDIDATPEQVLLALDARAARRGVRGPAALVGDWFGSRAVIAPYVEVRPVPPADAFSTCAVQAVDAPDGVIGGGWIGYLSYDLADPSGRSGALPVAAWGWTDEVLRLDDQGQWWYESLGADNYADYDRLLSADADGLLPDAQATLWTSAAPVRPDGSIHSKAIGACIDAIADGELFQANICTRFHGTFDGRPVDLFAEGVRTLQPRRAAYVAGHWGAVVSLSPEVFLTRRDRTARSTPIKGTLPRRGPGDAGNADRLRQSTKDVAENVMITDLVRNDLGRVSKTGSVQVTDLLTVRDAPGVWHLESTVESVLTDDTGDTELLEATFPPGSVTGAPKLRALELIADLEPEARGVYCGAVGMASPAAGLELNVAIRTFEVHEGRIALGVGGGITAASDPDAEWTECLHKAAPLEALLRRE